MNSTDSSDPDIRSCEELEGFQKPLRDRKGFLRNSTGGWAVFLRICGFPFWVCFS